MKKERKGKKKEENIDDRNLKFLSFYLKASAATVMPPLSSVLGNLGLKTGDFCKEFNSLTINLPSYLWIKVYLKVNMADRNWSIHLGGLPVTFLCRLVSLKKKIKLRGSGGFYFKECSYISLSNFFLLIIFYNGIITQELIKKNLGIIQSMDMLILNETRIVYNRDEWNEN